ncbi:MAG: peptidoglycan DL-endopeptidase CwlO [Frankiaceae bacterium]|nr:peptidoglycan DL-endopeptidase CwlO [Frankiaceae bacterium]
MLSAQKLRRRVVGAVTVAGIAAALPLATNLPQLAAAAGTTTASASAQFTAGDSGSGPAAEAVRGFAGALPTAGDAIPGPLGDPAPPTLAEATAVTRAAAARASRDLARQKLAAVRAAAQTRAVAAQKAALAAKKAALAAKKRKAAALAARTPGEIAVSWARQMLGRPYVWGATGPNSFDCSGLTRYVWSHAGVWLSHYSGAQFGEGRRVERASLRPGDLVFFGGDLHHVGIYIGNGQMINAPHSGTVVRVDSIDRSDYAGAVRPA